MHIAPIALIFAIVLAGTAQAVEHADWCTDAHMQQMDADVAKMTDAEKQKSAKMHLDMSKAEMKKNNIAGCVEHMQEAHKAMGL